MMQTDIVLSRTLRRLIVLELQQCQVHHAIGQEYAFRELAIGLPEFLQSERLLVKLRRRPRIGNADRKVANLAFALGSHGASSLHCRLAGSFALCRTGDKLPNPIVSRTILATG